MRCAMFFFASSALWVTFTAPAVAQDALDRTDPGLIEEQFELRIPLDVRTDVPETVAEQERVAQVDAPDGVFVGAIHVASDVLPASQFVSVIEPYIGRTLSPQQLQDLTSAVADRLRAEGYVFATAWISEQRLDTGMLRVSVDPGVISEIRYTAPPTDAVHAILQQLADGTPVREARLERKLMLAEDVPGIRVVGTRFFREEGRGVLEVAIQRDRVAGWARISNEGSEAVGPWRMQGGVAINSALTSGDRVRISASATPIEPGDFALVRLTYDVPLDDDGTTIRMSTYYARSNPEDGAQLNDRDGDSFGASISVRRALVRSRRASLWGNVTLRYRQTMQDDLGVPIREDRITTAELGLNGYVRVGSGHLSGGARLVQGLGIFGSSEEGDPLLSRFDGSGRFTKVELYGRWWQPIGAGFSVELRGRGQLASRALLASDEMGIGGPYYGRGYDYYERAGENGIAGSVELRHDIADVSDAINNIQLYSFLDGAGVRNLGDGGGGGRLTSAGGGVRIRIADSINTGLEAGVPLNEDRFDSDDRSPRVRVTLGADF